MRKLQEKKGSAMVMQVLFLMFFMLVFFAVFFWMQHRITVVNIQRTAEAVLESYTAAEGRHQALSVKNGTIYTPSLSSAQYQKLLTTALNTDAGMSAYRSGQLAFQVSNVKVNFSVANTINTNASFNVQIPVYWGKSVISHIGGQVYVKSKYTVVPDNGG